MLIEFSVGNYRSFKEQVTFSMVAANLVAKDKKLDENNAFAPTKELSTAKIVVEYSVHICFFFKACSNKLVIRWTWSIVKCLLQKPN